ncbi:desulfoferrodoxin FeS4 iron-binding domain-containing protein [Patescibacteria group bacterium]|nr:desulfoferrodoxin FeS4 iron-binding domain-containing protein [Patescibacteria group bacterium]
MVVKTVGEHYRCNLCGNEVKVVKAGKGTLYCCGQEMSLVGSGEQKPVDDEIPV